MECICACGRGVDGSDAAIDAAIWAIDEAVRRDVPLRIVHVTHIEDQRAATDDDFRLDVHYAEASVRAATAAVEATGTQVKIETEVLWGTVKTVLIDEPRNAAMICLGSVGIGAIAGKLLGSTAATLAKDSRCPVAIIRAPRRPHAAAPAGLSPLWRISPTTSRSSSTQWQRPDCARHRS